MKATVERLIKSKSTTASASRLVIWLQLKDLWDMLSVNVKTSEPDESVSLRCLKSFAREERKTL